MGSIEVKPKLKAIIIGAGPAGCAVAHGLKKAGIDFTIYEKGADVKRNRHWAFTLGWGRPFFFDLLPEEIASQINTCQVDETIDAAAIGEDRIVLYNGQTREEAFAFPIPQAREFNIRQLRILLASKLDVQYNKKFSNYVLHEGPKKGVTVYFEDGTSDTGDILLGLDGANSQIRKALLGSKGEMEVLPFALMNFNTSYTASQALYIKEKLHPLIDIAIHPDGQYMRTNVLDMPDRDDPASWTFQILTTWPVRHVDDHDNETDRLKRLKEHVRRDGWAEPYKSIIEWIPEDTQILKDQLKIWKTMPWQSPEGKVTLCGDAAHAMTFHRGQGANNAFFSAHCLVQALKSVANGTSDLPSAIAEYERNLWERGAKETQISKEQTFYTHTGLEEYMNSPVMKLGTKPSHSAKVEGYQ